MKLRISIGLPARVQGLQMPTPRVQCVHRHGQYYVGTMAAAYGYHRLHRCGTLKPEEWKRNTRLLPAPYTDRLSLDTPTLAKSLKEAGYATFFAGKWHLGPEGWWPENQGFDFNFGGIDRGGPYGGSKYFSPYGNPRLTDGPPR